MITVQQFTDICHEFGFVPKDGGQSIDLTNRSYACPGHLVARHNIIIGCVTMWMRRNKGTTDYPIMEYGVYEERGGEWSTMPNDIEVTADPDEFREHLCHFTALLKHVKKRCRLKVIEEL